MPLLAILLLLATLATAAPQNRPGRFNGTFAQIGAASPDCLPLMSSTTCPAWSTVGVQVPRDQRNGFALRFAGQATGAPAKPGIDETVARLEIPAGQLGNPRDFDNVMRNSYLKHRDVFFTATLGCTFAPSVPIRYFTSFLCAWQMNQFASASGTASCSVGRAPTYLCTDDGNEFFKSVATAITAGQCVSPTTNAPVFPNADTLRTALAAIEPTAFYRGIDLGGGAAAQHAQQSPLQCISAKNNEDRAGKCGYESHDAACAAGCKADGLVCSAEPGKSHSTDDDHQDDDKKKADSSHHDDDDDDDKKKDDSSSKKKRTIIIAAAAGGGALVLIAASVTAFCCIRRRRARAQAQGAKNVPPPTSTIPRSGFPPVPAVEMTASAQNHSPAKLEKPAAAAPIALTARVPATNVARALPPPPPYPPTPTTPNGGGDHSPASSLSRLSFLDTPRSVKSPHATVDPTNPASSSYGHVHNLTRPARPAIFSTAATSDGDNDSAVGVNTTGASIDPVPALPPVILLPTLYLADAIAGFEPELVDELVVRPGDVVRVTAEYQDGWAAGVNAQGRAGVFPLACVRRRVA
ncbi:hypothetical protein H9P43_003163 [Blastocladiella emersonii ATCC 22665]|nr:hypothetical protein H9P43_003163 [Blastocladiella emersonii ATCC 22665]